MISFIARPPAFLSEVNMQTFEHFSVIIISGAEPANGINVMLKGVKFRYVEVLPYPRVNEISSIPTRFCKDFSKMHDNYRALFCKVETIREPACFRPHLKTDAR